MNEQSFTSISLGFWLGHCCGHARQLGFYPRDSRVARINLLEIHRLDVNGAAHIANASDPSIPAALQPVVAGVISLTDFRAHPTSRQPAEHDRILILTRVTTGLDRLMQRSIAVSDGFEIHCLHH